MHGSLHSLFLAQAMGLYLVIVAIIMIARAKYYQDLLKHAKVGSSSVLVAATLGLVLGILIVLIHNHWLMSREVLVTIVGWIILVKSILWLGFPEMMINYIHKFYEGPSYYIHVIVAGILGVILMSYGFYQFYHFGFA